MSAEHIEHIKDLYQIVFFFAFGSVEPHDILLMRTTTTIVKIPWPQTINMYKYTHLYVNCI